MVRAKFKVQEVNRRQFSHGTQTTVILAPEYDNTIEEDRRFTKATPTGRFEMVIDNPVAVEYLKPGDYYYIDLTAVSEAVPA